MQVAAKLGGFITRVLADVASGSFDANAPQRAQQLRAVLSSLGPSFVKTGQALSGEEGVARGGAVGCDKAIAAPAPAAGSWNSSARNLRLAFRLAEGP